MYCLHLSLRLFFSRLEGIWMKQRQFAFFNIILCAALLLFYDPPITAQVSSNIVKY